MFQTEGSWSNGTLRLANTYVFFASDNGYHMGEHRLQPGSYTAYETDIHAPPSDRICSRPGGARRSDAGFRRLRPSKTELRSRPRSPPRD